MASYSIKDLERITGIKAHTIRIWEKRYNLVKPMRTDSNIRYYCDEELKRLLNVGTLVKNGYKISNLANMDNIELGNKIREVSMLESGFDGQIESLVAAMIDLNEENFEKILNSSIIKDGFEETVFNILYPFFEKVGILWQTGSISPAQEHFVSNLIKRKIFVAIDSLNAFHLSNPLKFILFLPEWELHEIGMLVYYYLIRASGHNVLYLGQSLPFNDLKTINESHKADFLLTAFSSARENVKLESYLQELVDNFTDQKILATGLQLEQSGLNIPEKIHLIKDARSFKESILTAL